LSLSASYALTVCCTDIIGRTVHMYFTQALHTHLFDLTTQTSTGRSAALCDSHMLHVPIMIHLLHPPTTTLTLTCYTDTHRSRHMCTKLMRRTHPCSTHIAHMHMSVLGHLLHPLHTDSNIVALKQAPGSFNDCITHTGRTPLMHLFVTCTRFKNNFGCPCLASHTPSAAPTSCTRARTCSLTHLAPHPPTQQRITRYTHLSTLALHKPTKHCTSTLVSLCRTRICQHSRNLHCHVHCYTQTAFCLALASLRFIHAHNLLR
jgi:hypothetical protein